MFNFTKEKLVEIIEDAFQKGYECFLDCKNEYVQQVVEKLEKEKSSSYYEKTFSYLDNNLTTQSSGNIYIGGDVSYGNVSTTLDIPALDPTTINFAPSQNNSQRIEILNSDYYVIPTPENGDLNVTQ